MNKFYLTHDWNQIDDYAKRLFERFSCEKFADQTPYWQDFWRAISRVVIEENETGSPASSSQPDCLDTVRTVNLHLRKI